MLATETKKGSLYRIPVEKCGFADGDGYHS